MTVLLDFKASASASQGSNGVETASCKRPRGHRLALTPSSPKLLPWRSTWVTVQLDFSAAASASQRKRGAGLIVSGLVSSEVDVGDSKFVHPKSSERLERLREPRDRTPATKTLILDFGECAADRQLRAYRSMAAMSPVGTAPCSPPL